VQCLSGVSLQDSIIRHHERLSLLFNECREGCVDLPFIASLQYLKPKSHLACGSRRLGMSCKTPALLGLTRMRTFVAFGAISRNSSNRFDSSAPPSNMTPVTLRPGWLMLSTSPCLTGSPSPKVNTMGIVDVEALAANATLLPPLAAITVT